LKFDFVKVALPLLSVRAPNTVVPSLNVTVPPGTPEVMGLTVVVNVTFLPYIDGFADETSEALVPAFFTVKVAA
jgi:hypothetical protein